MSEARTGAIVIQIDGLSHELLNRAIHLRLMPTIRKMLRKRGYVMKRTRAGLPATTPAYHAKALYGRTDVVPGFVWYDRAARRIRTMKNPQDARDVEAVLAANPGALQDGAAYGTFFLAGAKRAAFVASATELGQLTNTLPAWEFLEFLVTSTGALARMAVRSVFELALELWDYARSVLLREPRRGEFAFVVERIVANAVMREGVTAAVELDIHKGVPVIWANYPQYDVMSHHRGPKALRALLTLRGVDRCIRRIERAVRSSHAKPYDLYVLSDHGQVPAVPFDRIHGTDMRAWLVHHAALAGGAVGTIAEMRAADNVAESLSVVRHFRDALPWPMRRIAAVIERRLTRSLGRLGLKEAQRNALVEAAEIIVAPTGGTVAIYLDPSGRRVPLHEIEQTYPGLVCSLLQLDGVAALVAREREGEVTVVGPRGRLTVRGETDEGQVEGVDPLRGIADEKSTASDIYRLMAIDNSGDLVVLGGGLTAQKRWSFNKRHLNFAEQFGAHGGISPAEQNAFLLGPETKAEAIERVRWPEDVYLLLRSYS